MNKLWLYNYGDFVLALSDLYVVEYDVLLLNVCNSVSALASPTLSWDPPNEEYRGRTALLGRGATRSLRCSMCSSMFLEYTKMLSMKTTTKTSRYPCGTSWNKCMDYEGALVAPKGITKNLNRPQRV